MSTLEGILMVDKPSGPTSHDVVEEVRRFTGRLRVGHTGTLDPFATGLLTLCIGRATRLSRFLTASRKVYSGSIRLGLTTDTYDIHGRAASEKAVSDLDEATVRQAARRFTGTFMQAPPAYSARKVGGRPMHRLAREGKEFIVEPSVVTVHRLEILEVKGPLVRFEAETSPGTYIRSLAHDLGAALGCGGCLAGLRRHASGSFHVEEARSLEEILQRGRGGTLADLVRPLQQVDLGLPTITVTIDGGAAMRRGRALTARDLTLPFEPERAGPGADGPSAVRVQDEAGNLLGVAVPARDPLGETILRPDVVLVT